MAIVATVTDAKARLIDDTSHADGFINCVTPKLTQVGVSNMNDFLAAVQDPAARQAVDGILVTSQLTDNGE